jgi:hypothetical protein
MDNLELQMNRAENYDGKKQRRSRRRKRRLTMARRKRRSSHEFVEGLRQLPATIDGTEFVIRILRGRAEEVGIGDEEEDFERTKRSWEGGE